MHKVIAIILLILHINNSMFIPVMDEFEMFDVHGAVVDDVNSAYELVDQVILGHEDNSKDSESEDHAHYFSAADLKIFVAPQLIITTPRPEPLIVWIDKPDYVFRPEDKWTSVTHEIIVPPPKA